VEDEDRPFAPCGVEWVAEDTKRKLTTLRVTLREGRNRQVRRVGVDG
jgi:16S rRNA U516 pseudouridylate synthase RsuA-like enzyme